MCMCVCHLYIIVSVCSYRYMHVCLYIAPAPTSCPQHLREGFSSQHAITFKGSGCTLERAAPVPAHLLLALVYGEVCVSNSL